MNARAAVIRPMTIRTVIPFFAMAFGLSWGVAALALGFADQLEPIFGPIGLTNPLFFVAVYASAIAGIGLVLRHYGVRGLRSYLRRLTLGPPAAASSSPRSTTSR